MSGEPQSAQTDYVDLELLYNAYMAPALTVALRDLFDSAASPTGGIGLDVGCGPGGLLPLLAEASDARHIVGVDLAAAHLRAAGATVARHDLGRRVSLAAIDLRKSFPFADGAFDWAWAADVLWPDIVPAPWQVVAELRRVVRPGGCVAAYFGNWLRALFLPGHSHIEHALSAATEATCFARTLTPAAHYENALGWLRSAGLVERRLSAYLVQYRQPLPPAVRLYIQDVIFAEYRQPQVGQQAIASGLTPADWRHWLAISEPGSPNNLLDDPDYYCLQIGKLMTGIVPATSGDALRVDPIRHDRTGDPLSPAVA
jgi:SAM-dependent methyltransferase